MNHGFEVGFKENAVKMVLELGLSATEAAKRCDIANQTLYRWLSEYKNNKSFKDSPMDSNKDDEIKRLKKELSLAKMEITILKKATMYFAKEAHIDSLLST